jgi:monoamine oxidase
LISGKIFMKALEKPNDDFQNLPWKETVKKYDKYSLRSWLTGNASLSPDTVDYISVFYNIEPFLDVGLVEILVDECVQVEPDFVYIRHGMDLLPRAMAENLNIQYNAKVTEIDQSGYKIRVKIDCKVQ